MRCRMLFRDSRIICNLNLAEELRSGSGNRGEAGVAGIEGCSEVAGAGVGRRKAFWAYVMQGKRPSLRR